MRYHVPLVVVSLALTFAAVGHALPPGARDRGFREGANHHLGDDGFVAQTGRAPTASDGEAARMHAHLVHVRAWLASRPATRPELLSKRAELLGYLDEYIAKGKTPRNEHLPWRSTVFIDDDGTICAVGYLIERSVGRAVAEKIAAEHRYDLLEDIAVAMPDVDAWIASSGLSLEELASIQPGYMAPIVETWHPWALAKWPLPEGPFEERSDEGTTRGSVRGGQMDGAWTRTTADGAKVIGSGMFSRGKGTWRSFRRDGSKMAEGPFDDNRPDGTWRFFHPSGNVAAEGSFAKGYRHGAWQFFYDGKEHVPIAEGSFAHGSLVGTWHHFDAAGKLLATSRPETPATWGGSQAYLLHVVPGKDGIQHWVHQGNIAGDHHRLDMVYDGVETLYVEMSDGSTYDRDGQKLTDGADGFAASDCHWTSDRKRAARAGDVVTLHALLSRDRYDEKRQPCDGERPVGAERAKRIDALLSSVRAVRAQSPEFVRALALGDRILDPENPTRENSESAESSESSTSAEDRATNEDLAKVLAANMTWYVEWPHVDGRFISLFRTLPGYATRDPGSSSD